MAWKWDGGPAVLMSRAVDETGAAQIPHRAFIAERGRAHRYHYHAIASWSVSAAGEVRNVYVVTVALVTARFRVSAAVLLASVIGVATIVARQNAPAATTTSKDRAPAPARKVAPKGPGLGVPATAAQIESADVSIGPDGAGLPPGSGTPAQGEAIFNTKCIACHGRKVRAP